MSSLLEHIITELNKKSGQTDIPPLRAKNILVISSVTDS